MTTQLLLKAKVTTINEYGFKPDRGGAGYNTVVYPSFKSETIMDNLQNRRSRPYKLLQPIVEQELKTKGLMKEGDKLSWSQKAGCKMCPCSPGWILKTPGYGGVLQPPAQRKSIWCEVVVKT